MGRGKASNAGWRWGCERRKGYNGRKEGSTPSPSNSYGGSLAQDRFGLAATTPPTWPWTRGQGAEQPLGVSMSTGKACGGIGAT